MCGVFMHVCMFVCTYVSIYVYMYLFADYVNYVKSRLAIGMATMVKLTKYGRTNQLATVLNYD